MMNRIATLFAAVGIATAIPAAAQSFNSTVPLIGPSAAFVISTASLDSSTTSTTRFTIGGHFVVPFRTGTELRLGLSFRSDNGDFTVPYLDSAVAEGAATSQPSRLNVVDPITGREPQINSSIAMSAVELQGMIYFPLTKLDTTGSRILVGIGAFADMQFSAKQTDDYSTIPGHPDPDVQEYTYDSQLGGGVLLGLSVVLPMGEATRLSFDLYYMFREPDSVTRKNDAGNTVTQATTWVNGRGLRIGASLLFGL